MNVLNQNLQQECEKKIFKERGDRVSNLIPTVSRYLPRPHLGRQTTRAAGRTMHRHRRKSVVRTRDIAAGVYYLYKKEIDGKRKTPSERFAAHECSKKTVPKVSGRTAVRNRTTLGPCQHRLLAVRLLPQLTCFRLLGGTPGPLV